MIEDWGEEEKKTSGLASCSLALLSFLPLLLLPTLLGLFGQRCGSACVIG